MNKFPLISIITPVYNGGYPFVCCLLTMARSQFSDYEFIVVDDGSTDESAAIAKKFGFLHSFGEPEVGRSLNWSIQLKKG